MTVQYFALDHTLRRKILKNVLPTSWKLTSYDPEQSTEVLFLFSPIWCHEHFISADLTWKLYLAKHNPQTKLISLGVQKAQHPNYIDLLQPPENYSTFLEKAKACGEDWIPVDTQGLNMNQKLRRFFEGHGKESLIDSFNIILRSFRVVQDEIKQGVPYLEIRRGYLVPQGTFQDWQKLTNRWRGYLLFFPCLPFWNIFEKINRILSEVQAFFDQDGKSYKLLCELQIPEKIETINKLLKQVENYVQKKPPHIDR